MAQVIEHKITAAEKDVIKEELEATVGMQLDHPNVVHTLKHTTRVMSQVRCAERATAGAGSGVRRSRALCSSSVCLFNEAVTQLRQSPSYLSTEQQESRITGNLHRDRLASNLRFSLERSPSVTNL